MIRFSDYDVSIVFDAMSNKGKYARLPDGNKFKRRSPRLVLFKSKGVECAECGIQGSFFALESHSPDVSPHLNLYAVVDNGGNKEDIKEVLMTKDHIFPRSKGGGDVMENYQTMCSPCNAKKADKS